MSHRLRSRPLPSTLLLSGLLIGAGALFAGGCGLFRGSVEESTVPLSVQVTGASDLNGGGNAAFVHIYQLSENAGFRNTPPESFWQAPDQAIGDGLLSSSQIQLFPGDDETVALEIGPDVRYVGIAANLRDPDRDRWRAVFPVEDLAGRTVHVTVDTNSLSTEIR